MADFDWKAWNDRLVELTLAYATAPDDGKVEYAEMMAHIYTGKAQRERQHRAAAPGEQARET